MKKLIILIFILVFLLISCGDEAGNKDYLSKKEFKKEAINLMCIDSEDIKACQENIELEEDGFISELENCDVYDGEFALKSLKSLEEYNDCVKKAKKDLDKENECLEKYSIDSTYFLKHTCSSKLYLLGIGMEKLKLEMLRYYCSTEEENIEECMNKGDESIETLNKCEDYNRLVGFKISKLFKPAIKCVKEAKEAGEDIEKKCGPMLREIQFGLINLCSNPEDLGFFGR